MNWNGPLQKINDFRFEIPSNYQGAQNNLHMKTSGDYLCEQWNDRMHSYG